VRAVRFAFSAFWLGAAVLWWSGGWPRSNLRFDHPASEIVARLEGATRKVEGTGMGSLDLTGFPLDPRHVRITVSRNGNPEVVSCLVDVTDRSETSASVAVDCPIAAEATDSATGKAGREAITMVVTEHVVATVLSRPYDIDTVANHMMRLMVRRLPGIAAEQLEEP
jgi:hypothetical protein